MTVDKSTGQETMRCLRLKELHLINSWPCASFNRQYCGVKLSWAVLQRCSDLINFLNDAVERVCRSIVEEQGVRTSGCLGLQVGSLRGPGENVSCQLVSSVFGIFLHRIRLGGHGQVLRPQDRFEVPPLSTPINYWQPPTQDRDSSTNEMTDILKEKKRVNVL